MKLKKKSGLMGAVIALSAASLVSVGFASWVISQGDDEVVEGNIIVDTAETKSHTIAYKWVDANGVDLASQTIPSVIFGHPGTVKNASDWFYHSEQANATTVAAAEFKENLGPFRLKISVSNLASTDTPADIFKTLTLTSSGGGTSNGKTGFAGAAQLTYVDELQELEAPAAFDFDGTVGSIILDLQFGWGDFFNNSNPYNFYNTGAGNTDANKTGGAEATMNELHTLLDTAKYVVSIATN